MSETVIIRCPNGVRVFNDEQESIWFPSIAAALREYPNALVPE